MQKYLKGILFIVGAIVLVIVGLVLKSTNFAGYTILFITGGAIAFLLGLFSIINNSNPTKLYEAKVRNILNTYDSILVQSNKIPSLEGRNVVTIKKMEDLVDAQLELRKPICYLKQTESCSFVLLDEKEAFVYVEKLRDDVVSPVEIELNELKLKEKDRDDMDAEMLKAIDKTTVVKLSNRKSYKVSPIRKKTEGDDKVDLTSIMKPVTEETVPPVPQVEEPAFPVTEQPATPEPTPVVEPPVDIPEVPQPEPVEEKVPKVPEPVTPEVPVTEEPKPYYDEPELGATIQFKMPEEEEEEII